MNEERKTIKYSFILDEKPLKVPEKTPVPQIPVDIPKPNKKSIYSFQPKKLDS